MSVRVFGLCAFWFLFSTLVPFIAAYAGPVYVQLVKSPVGVIPWLAMTAVVVVGVLYAPEEV